MIKKLKKSQTLTTVLILLNVVLLQWVASGVYLRFDLSGSGQYKITSSSKKILRELPEDVFIEAFFSDEVPELYYQRIRNLRDFLTEYAGSSKGNVRVVFLDPDSDEDVKRKAHSLGIKPMPIGSFDQQSQQLSNVYFSLALTYENKTEVIPDVLRLNEALEYHLTSRIHKMAHPGQMRAGILKGTLFQTSQSQNELYSLELLDKNMELFYGKLIEVDATLPIPGEINTLCIFTPLALSPQEKYQIDQFLLRGGNLILAINGVHIDFNQLAGRPIGADIPAFFQHYGINIEQNLVLEPESFIPIRQNTQSLRVLEIPYPQWVLVPEKQIEQSHPITSHLNTLFLPWASAISVDPGKMKNSNITLLAQSSPQSQSQKEPFYVNPNIVKQVMQNITPESATQYTLAFYIEAQFTSFFQADKSMQQAGFLSESAAPARVMVVSSPFAFSNMGIRQSQGVNLNFFLTTLDIINGLEELVEARSRKPANPQLEAAKPWVQKIITLANFLLPLLFIGVYGLLRFLSRKQIGDLTYQPLSQTKPSEEGS